MQEESQESIFEYKMGRISMGYLIKGAIWDMDGVLVDSKTFHFESWRIVMENIGVSITWDQFASVFGQDNRGGLASFLGRPPEEELLAVVSPEKERVFRELIKGKAQPLPGVLDWLERFRQVGVRQAVATSAPPGNIAVIEDMQLSSYFDRILSAPGEGLPGKPDPAIFLSAADSLGLDPGECVVFEDAVAGVEAAKRAGMVCVAITSTNPREKLARADLIVEDFNQIPEGFFRFVTS